MSDDENDWEVYRMNDHKQPWWNDGDRVAGLAATVVLILFLGVLIVGFIKFAQWAL